MTTPKTIVILGATGNQGSGVVRALLSLAMPVFHVRAVTRDVSSSSAQRLLQQHASSADRLSLVSGDVYDVDSLQSAFADAHGLFAVTNNRLPGKGIETEADLAHELDAGRNIIEAAQRCNVQHFVFSSLPSIEEASGGRFSKVFHFDNKHHIEELARARLPCVTTLLPGLFYSNMTWPQYCRRDASGAVRFCAPVDGNVSAEWVDAGHDIGVFASKIFALGPNKTRSKRYPVVSRRMRFDELPEIFARFTQQSAYFEPVSLHEWGKVVSDQVGKGYEQDIIQMMQWISVAPTDKTCYGTMELGENLSAADLGVEASTFEQWLGRSRWTGPVQDTD